MAGFYPFDFVVINKVRWLSPGPGVSFSGHAMVRSAEALDLSAAPGLTLEFLVEPADEPSRELGKLLVLFDGALPENLQVAQWRKYFLVRTPVWDARGRRRYREMSSGAADLRKGVRRFIAVTSGPGGTRFYADGVPLRAYPKTTLAPSTLRGALFVATGANAGYSWKGKLYGFALFCDALDGAAIARHGRLWAEGLGREIASEPSVAGLYLFDEGNGRTVRDAVRSGPGLEIPALYHPPFKRILAAPWEEWKTSWSHMDDIIVNIVGFMPFGFFYYVYRERVRPGRRVSNLVCATVVSGVISLVIELLQIYLPTRSSSLTDVICNILGGMMGAAVMFTLQGRATSVSSVPLRSR